MVELQVLSKVLNDKSVSILELNNITPDYFITYPDEYQFIMEHYQKYGNVPDKETFIHKFPDFFYRVCVGDGRVSHKYIQ